MPARSPECPAGAGRLRHGPSGWFIIAILAAATLCPFHIAPAHGLSSPLAYGPLASEVVELCRQPMNGSPRPAILLIHGGGWTGGDKAALTPRCHALAAAGYVVININYRLSDGTAGHSWPAALVDAKLALTWVRLNAGSLGVDVRHIAVVGESVGAQLALFLGVADRDNGVRCVVAESAPVDLLTAPSFTARIDPVVFANEPAPAAYKSASPAFVVDRDTAPTMIVHGRADDLVPVSQAEELLAVLHRHGVPAVMVTYEGGHILQDATEQEKRLVIATETSYLDDCLHPGGHAGRLR